MIDNDKKIFEAWVAMIRSHQLFMDAVEKALKDAGMPPLSWYDVLLEINRAKDKRLRLQDIGDKILLAKNNTTRLVDRLEREKLVIRKKCENDGRGVYAYITQKGEGVLKTMWPVYRQAVREHFGSYISDAELDRIIACYKNLKSGGEHRS